MASIPCLLRTGHRLRTAINLTCPIVGQWLAARGCGVLVFLLEPFRFYRHSDSWQVIPKTGISLFNRGRIAKAGHGRRLGFGSSPPSAKDVQWFVLRSSQLRHRSPHPVHVLFLEIGGVHFFCVTGHFVKRRRRDPGIDLLGIALDSLCPLLHPHLLQSLGGRQPLLVPELLFPRRPLHLLFCSLDELGVTEHDTEVAIGAAAELGLCGAVESGVVRRGPWW